LKISFEPEEAARQELWIPWWDFLFYASFGLVVTSSVRIAGVLLVFSYLIVPAAVAALLTTSVTGRLLIGWALGFVVSVLGLIASAVWDLPTGATIVTTFGVFFGAVPLVLGAGFLFRAIKVQGLSALCGPGLAAFSVLALAGLLLLIFPQMDHHWLNWTEEAFPAVRLSFLTPDERQTYQDSYESAQRGLAEIEQLRTKQQEVRWGTREMSEEMQERLRQYLAGRSEITAGDQMALKHLRSKARERQRYWLGLPLLGLGAVGAFTLLRMKRRTATTVEQRAIP